MNVKVSVVLVWLGLMSLGSQRASACMTADTDLSGGGWETSAATDPCTSVISGHGGLQAGAQFPGEHLASAQNTPSKFLSHEVSGDSRATLLVPLLLLIASSFFGLTHDDRDASGVSRTRLMGVLGL